MTLTPLPVFVISYYGAPFSAQAKISRLKESKNGKISTANA
jgi:hypothetical protein